MVKDSLDEAMESLRKTLEEAKDLTTKKRNNLDNDQFAVPGKRKLPIHDCSHARNAAARLNQTEGLTSEEKRIARQKIEKKLKECQGK